MKIALETMEVKPASTPLAVDDTLKSTMVEQARALLTEPLEKEDLVNALEFFYIYGKAPLIEKGAPQVAGNHSKVSEGYESLHYSKRELKKAVDVLYAELNPVPEPEVIEEPVEESLPEITK